METGWPAEDRPGGEPQAPQALQQQQPQTDTSSYLKKRINTEKDVIYFKNESSAYGKTLTYVNLLCEKIHSTSNKVLRHKYTLADERFQKCAKLLDELSRMCDETDLTSAKGSAPLRFGHIAFRDWFDAVKEKCREFINIQLAPERDDQLRAELLSYLSDSFGNKMRIDYGTGHELNFLIFTMGLSNLYYDGEDDQLREFVQDHGWDILALFSHNYLRLCRKFQTKFRLEPAGSRGVYNMDDFQYLPFLFGAAQLSGVKHIPSKEFFTHDTVDIFKSDYIFLEAVDFILNSKRGPFHEHSYTLWCMADLGSWENIYRRIKNKFVDDVLGPFPIVQHLLFGKYVLVWEKEGANTKAPGN